MREDNINRKVKELQEFIKMGIKAFKNTFERKENVTKENDF